MKFAVGLIVLTGFCGILYAQNHTVQWGTQTFNERMLDRQFVRKSSSWMKVVIEELTWPNVSAHFYFMSSLLPQLAHQIDGLSTYNM